MSERELAEELYRTICAAEGKTPQRFPLLPESTQTHYRTLAEAAINYMSRALVRVALDSKTRAGRCALGILTGGMTCGD